MTPLLLIRKLLNINETLLLLTRQLEIRVETRDGVSIRSVPISIHEQSDGIIYILCAEK